MNVRRPTVRAALLAQATMNMIAAGGGRSAQDSF
jgi:hypothetical protein